MVRVQEFKLDRLKEVQETESDWEAIDEAINRILFTDELNRTMDESDEIDDEPTSEGEYDTRLPWDS